MELQQNRGLYHFGAFWLDAAERRLWCEDEPVLLTPKQFDLLFYFVENAGRVTKKSELLDAVWADTYIEETTLARNVSWLRKTIGEHADGESIIDVRNNESEENKRKITCGLKYNYVVNHHDARFQLYIRKSKSLLAAPKAKILPSFDTLILG